MVEAIECVKNVGDETPRCVWVMPEKENDRIECITTENTFIVEGDDGVFRHSHTGANFTPED